MKGPVDFDEEEEYEDEYCVVSLSAHARAVALDPDERVKAVRDYLVIKLDIYLNRCASVAGARPASSEYIRLISNFLPIKQIMVGQSPYSADILPRYGAAFAFNRAKAGFWTPTSQVLAQCMEMYEGISLPVALSYISHSFLLICRGVVLVNVYAYQGLNDQQQAKMSSYFAELLSDMVLASVVADGGGRSKASTRVSQVEFGDEAKIAGDYAWASMKSMKGVVSRVSVVNPVWVSRTFGRDSQTLGPECTAADTELCTKYDPPEDAHDDQVRTKRAPMATTWCEYSADEMAYLRPRSTLKVLCDVARRESITHLSKEFDRRVAGMSTHARRQENTDDDKEPDESKSYTHRVLQRLEEDSTSTASVAQAAIAELKVKLEKLNPRDAAQVESMTSVLETAVKSMVMAAGFFSSVPGVLGNEASAISLSTNTVPPLVRAYRPETATQKSSGLTLKKIARKEVAVAGMEEAVDSKGEPRGSLTPRSHVTDPPHPEEQSSQPVIVEAVSPSIESYSAAGYSELSGPSMEASDAYDPFDDDFGVDLGPVENLRVFGKAPVATGIREVVKLETPRVRSPSTVPNTPDAPAESPSGSTGNKQKKVLKIRPSKKR